MLLLMATFVRTFGADHAELSTIRREFSAWAAEQVEQGLIEQHQVDDAAVVLTELVANAIDHTTSPSVELVIKLRPRHLLVEVRNEGAVSDVPAPADWGAISSGDRGRGLRLVRALGHHVDVLGDEDATVVRWRLDLS